MRGDHFSLIYLANQAGEHRLGISIHGVKSAVKRNRLKRIVREFYRHHRSFIGWGQAAKITPGEGVDVIFAIRSGFASDSPQDMERAVRGLLEKRRAGGKSVGGRKDNAEGKKS